MYNAIATTKRFVRKHKTAITVVATAAPLLALVVRNQNLTNEFLKEHNLYEEFYALDGE